MIQRRDLCHVVVAYDPTKWAAVPANNGGNGPTWQWGHEMLVGYSQGPFAAPETLHQTSSDGPFTSWLARSTDGGETWTTWRPHPYVGDPAQPAPPPGDVDVSAPGFVLRVQGNGYHGNAGACWFYSQDKGTSWQGPFGFGGLLDHPELAGMEFTGRTAYLAEGSGNLLLFLSARRPSQGSKLQVHLTDKAFVARMTKGGKAFTFLSWIVPKDDPYRAVMPAPVRLSQDRLVAALRRKSAHHNWIDAYASDDGGKSWHHLAQVGATEDANAYNGNPPALVRTFDGRLCCVYGHRSRRQIIVRVSHDGGATWGPEMALRSDFASVNGQPDLGYPRLFQRPDGKLVTAYFWCTAERPQTHIEASIFALRDS